MITQKEAIEKLKKLKDKIDFKTTPRLWTVRVEELLEIVRNARWEG